MPRDLKKEFLEFHAKNPHVYERMLTISRQLKARGFSKYSTRTLMCVLRFEWDLQTSHEEVVVDGGETRSLKLNDHHTPYYARMLMKNHPDLLGFFEVRTVDGDDGIYPPPPSAFVPRKRAKRTPMTTAQARLL